MDVRKFSPFDDPRVQQKQRVTARASYKAFNAVAGRLLNNLLRMYPSDATIRFLMEQYTEVAEDKVKYKIPAGAFFKEIRNPAVDSDGNDVEYVDLLAKHDPKALQDPIPVMVIRGMGMAAKWKDMDAQMREDIWGYIDRLVHLSAQAVFSGSGAKDEMNELSRATVTAAMAGKTSPEDMASDPKVQAAATKFVDTVQ